MLARYRELLQRRPVDELVEKYDMILDSQCSHARHKALAVGLAVMPNEIGVRRTENDIHRILMAFQDRGHGINHDLYALIGREKAERQNDGPAAEAQFKLRLVGLYECHVGNSVRHDLDLFRRHPVYCTQQLPTFLGHDDDL